MSGAGAHIGWVDCTSGCSGDMLLGAALDAGVPLPVVTGAISAVVPERIDISTELVLRSGFAAARAVVHAIDPSPRRTWADVRALLEESALTPAVRNRALSTFARLADAEAAVHGSTPDRVHFHEVGALDAVADVVGVCASLQHLGLDVVTASPVALGGGTVRTSHGTTGVPPPAVARLLRGVPTHGGPADTELCTPTGAALLAEWVTGWGTQPAMVTTAVGVGAGSRELDEQPNVLRLFTGTTVSPATAHTGGSVRAALLMECNVDDIDPRLWPDVLVALLEAGASDAWLTPILMKKGRPAHTLSVLVAPDEAERVRQMIFSETTTIGVRETTVGRHALDRRDEAVDVDGQRVRVKVAMRDGVMLNAQPEYDDVAAAAAATGQPAKSVLSRAIAQACALS